MSRRRETYVGRVRLKDGPLAGQVREVTMAYGCAPPKFARFIDDRHLVDFYKPMTSEIRVYTYKSTLWRKGFDEWYEWTYVEEI